MKTPYTYLLAITLTFVFISACNKDKNSPESPPTVRLAGFVKEFPSDTSTTVFHYDAGGKITSIELQPLHGPSMVQFEIQYTGNEIRLTNPVTTNSYSNSMDTVRLYMDANNRVTQRIQKMYFEYTADPTYNPRAYTWDTTSYQYDAAGLLAKQIHSKHDSTWSWNGMAILQENRNVEATDYTNQNGNVISSSGLKTGTGRTYIPSTGQVTNSSGTTLETTTTYGYAQNNPNKGDFTNEAVLNEVFIFDAFYANKNYKNVPNHLAISQVQKDNGTVVNTQNFIYDYTFTYDSDGNIKTMESQGPHRRWTYNYEKP